MMQNAYFGKIKTLNAGFFSAFLCKFHTLSRVFVFAHGNIDMAVSTPFQGGVYLIFLCIRGRLFEGGFKRRGR